MSKVDFTASEGWAQLFISDQCGWSLKFVGSVALDLMNDELRTPTLLWYIIFLKNNAELDFVDNFYTFVYKY